MGCLCSRISPSARLPSRSSRRRANPAAGYEPLLEQELRPILARLPDARHRDRQQLRRREPARRGGAHPAPRGGARPARAAHRSGRRRRPVGCARARRCCGRCCRASMHAREFVSANVYQGAFEIAEALREGAQIVVTGRVADPVARRSVPRSRISAGRATTGTALAGATMAGHLLECGAQVTGGYFADPGLEGRARSRRRRLSDRGDRRATAPASSPRPSHTGGLVDVRTVKEQLLYEIHDPAAYLTPDVVADITRARSHAGRPDRVRLSRRARPSAAGRRSRRSSYFEGGWLGEAEISYAGPERRGARAARDGHRAQAHGPATSSALRPHRRAEHPRRRCGTHAARAAAADARDVRLRAAARHDDAREIDRLLREVYSLWLAGPAGGGGVRTAKRQRLSNVACYVPREQVPARFAFVSWSMIQRDARSTFSLHRIAHARTGRQGQSFEHQRVRLRRRGLRASWSSRSPKRASRSCSPRARPTR